MGVRRHLVSQAPFVSMRLRKPLQCLLMSYALLGVAACREGTTPERAIAPGQFVAELSGGHQATFAGRAEYAVVADTERLELEYIDTLRGGSGEIGRGQTGFVLHCPGGFPTPDERSVAPFEAPVADGMSCTLWGMVPHGTDIWFLMWTSFTGTLTVTSATPGEVVGHLDGAGSARFDAGESNSVPPEAPAMPVAIRLRFRAQPFR